MRDLFAMWRSTRMVVLAAISAALYAAALIAFKFLSILPGVTEIRPGTAFVVLCSILFGPAGAWGAAIGNTIGDLAGGLGPGTAVGFFANLLFGFIPYKLLRALGVEDPAGEGRRGAAALALACLASSGACAATVGAGIQALGLWPIAFQVLAPMIFATNSVVTLALCPFLLRAIYPRVRALGLRWQDVLDRPPAPRGAWRTAAGLGAVLGVGAALGLGTLAAYGKLLAGAPLLFGALDLRIALVVAAPLGLAVAALAIADP